MPEILNIDNIRIIGINDWRYKNFFLTEEYREFKKEIYYQMNPIKLQPPQRISMLLSMYLDIDNPIKPIIDAIEPVFGNDRNILNLNITKIPIPKGQPGKIKIWGDSIT